MGRLLITGASGNLGRPLSALAASSWETTGTYLHNPEIGGGKPAQLDLRNREAALELVLATQPDVIIHAATSDRSTDMARTNQAAAQHITEAARMVGCRLIALSSDMIYDGSRSPYDEIDPPTPLTPYGHVKAENERYFLAAYDGCLVVRTSLIYDLTPDNQQIAWMLESLAADQTVRLFSDEVRQPIWAWNLAEALLELAARPVTGLLNVAGPIAVSRWELGCALLEALGYDPATVASPASVAEAAPSRPRVLTLRLDRALALLSAPLLPLDEALRRAKAQAYG